MILGLNFLPEEHAKPSEAQYLKMIFDDYIQGNVKNLIIGFDYEGEFSQFSSCETEKKCHDLLRKIINHHEGFKL